MGQPATDVIATRRDPEGGEGILRFDGESWSIFVEAPANRFHGIIVFSPDNILAYGENLNTDKGRIVRWDGELWRRWGPDFGTPIVDLWGAATE